LNRLRSEDRIRKTPNRRNSGSISQGVETERSHKVKKQYTSPTIPMLSVLIIFSLLPVSALMATTPYISKDVDVGMELVPSECHEFSYVRAYNDGDEFVLYGKVDHRHTHCVTEGHVEATVLNAAGEKLKSMSLPIVKRGNRRKGWSGAHFRVRLSQKLSEGTTLRLAFDDPECFTGDSFDCGNKH